MTVGLSLMAIFSIFTGYFFGKVSVTIQDMQSLVGLSVITNA